MTSRNLVKLRDICGPRGLIGGPFGSKLVSRDYTTSGVPVVRGQNLASAKFVDFRDCVCVSEEKVSRDLATNLAVPGDLVFTQRGTLGQVAMMPVNGPDRAVISQSQMRLRVDPSRAVPEYVYYACVSEDFLFQVEINAIVTGVPHINLGILGDLTIPLPPLHEQRRIAEVLGALDDLIDTNERSIDKLAETFDAHSWATAFSTPEVIELGSKISLQKGVSYKGAFLADSGLPLINLASFSRAGSIAEQGTKYYTGPVPPRKLLRAGDLVVANTDLTQERLLLGRPTIVLHESASSTHHTFQVAVEDSVDRLWVYSLLRHEPRREYLASFATGTTVTALPADALTGLEVPWPDRERLERWHQVAAPLLEAARALEIENSELRRTRDELLPLLMSGAVRVRPEGAAA